MNRYDLTDSLGNKTKTEPPLESPREDPRGIHNQTSPPRHIFNVFLPGSISFTTPRPDQDSTSPGFFGL